MLAPHGSTTNYEFAANRVLLPDEANWTWTWDNKNIGFAEGSEFIVEGDFAASNTEFSASGDPWKGVVFEDGSVGNITNGSVVEEFNYEEGNNGIDILGGTVTISDSQILNDNWPWGYGIEVSDGTLTLEDSYVFADRGHGVLARSDGSVLLKNTDFEVYHADDGLSAVAANWGGEVDDSPSAVYYGTGNFLRATGSSATRITANAGTYLCGTSLGTYPEMVYASDDADVNVNNAFWADLPTGDHTTQYNGGDISATGPTLASTCLLSSSKGGTASSWFAGSSKHDPDLEHSLLGRARRAARSKDFNNAESLYLQVLAAEESSDDIAFALDGLVSVVRHTENFTSLLPEVDRIRSKFAEMSPFTHNIKARILAHSGDYSAAEEELVQLDKIAAQSVAAFETRIDLAYIMRRYPKRVATLLEALVPITEEQQRTLVRAYRVSGIEVSPSQIRQRSVAVSDPAVSVVNAYPNPFNPTTTIIYNLSSLTHVNMEVFDLLGRSVAVLVNESQNAGRHHISWTGANLPSGTYILRMNAPEIKINTSILLRLVK
ncbi:MAG: T9SS type A sorting domain-containing protein [Bacteroidetes bacterium]|nr:T9SS type A sorting domain-containing protein [Bacteroidota bacterium]